MLNIVNGLPVSEHPMFKECWNRYTITFNDLACKLEKVDIDISLLNELVAAAQDIERISFDNLINNEITKEMFKEVIRDKIVNLESVVNM